jgi:2-polyprenyl-3-methyl-5-hydroxy-6-metoxy-1,4-benzoquinol methylase
MSLSKNIAKDFIKKASWYHTIRFPHGLISQGTYDHQPVLKYYGFPKSLKNKSVLDVGAADGFFSFELEKRGAKSILAIDTHKFDGSIGHSDISPAKINNYLKKYKQFENEKKVFADICQLYQIKAPIRLLIAKKILKSKVKFRIDSIYNLHSWKKKFNFVFCGDLIEHLKNPLEALENLVSVSKKFCLICLSNSLKSSPLLNLFPKKKKILLEYHGNEAGGSFFHFPPPTFKEMCLASGFKKVKIFSEFDLKNKKTGRNNHHTVFHCFV